MLALTLLALGFILASGFFAMIDAAILSVTPAEVEVMIMKQRWGAATLKKLLRHTTRAIIVVVMFTNITNILGPILVGRKAEAVFGSTAIGVVTAILTFATIVFSEIIPKAIGAHNAPRISRIIAPLLSIVVLILFPIVYALETLVHLFRSGKRNVGTEEQIRALANLGGTAGHIDADERELIHKAFVLNDRTTADVMTPLSDIIACQIKTPIRHAAKMVFAHNYSRYPVTGENPTDIRGYVLSRDILEMLAFGKGDAPVTGILRKVPVVEREMRCDDLLHFLRKNMAQIAIVRHGTTTVGLVTLEDVLEELVGSIADEHDPT